MNKQSLSLYEKRYIAKIQVIFLMMAVWELVLMYQTTQTCSPRVQQLFISLSLGHQGVLKSHSAYFIAERMKAYTIYVH